ncbi:MAG: virulence-associated E family protein, partial [Lachnospiraceae bacterium]|nr:virulence-associated E family protein [Lachnospiraceae bacterium]
LLPYLKGGRFVVFGDNDKAGIADAERITALLNTVGTARMIIPPEVAEKGDISDYMKTHAKEDLQKLIDCALLDTTVTKKGDVSYSVTNVLNMLTYKIDYDRNGNEKSRKILQTVRNFEIVLENDKRFAHKIKYNEFAQRIYLIGDMPWTTKDNCRAWSSYDDSALFAILQSDYGLNSRNDYFDAIKNVSMQNRYHPVRDMLDALEWNGKEHIKSLLPDYLGAEDSQYNYEVMKLFMLGAVARIYKPGTKFDYTPIFSGKQGLGKSTFLRLLALNDNWVNDSLDSLDSDKAAQSLLGSWVIELAELKSLARTAGGVDSVKRFLSATQDKYRVPYERRADIFLRQSVFFGTTNRSDFLQDETGNRRFLVVQV